MAECGKKLNADQWQSGRVGRMTAAQGQLSLESVRYVYVYIYRLSGVILLLILS